MVGATLRGEDYFGSVLETIYSGLEGLDTTAYAWDASDRWTQSRTPDQWGAHLECWADLGANLRMDRTSYTHDCRLMFACRYQADSDSIAQARIHAAIYAASVFLMGLHFRNGGRVVAVIGISLEGPYSGEWVIPTIRFTLRLPR